MSSYRQQQLKYVCADMLSAPIVWLCFLLFRWLVYEGKVFGIDTVLIPAFSFWMPLVLYPIACLTIYYLSGYYLRPFHKSLSTDLKSTLICSVILALGAFFFIIIDDEVSDYSNYLWSMLVLFLLQFTLSAIPRLCITLYNKKHPQSEPCTIIEQDENMNEDALYQAIATAFPKGGPIYVVPRMYDILVGAAQIGKLDQNPYICITKQHMSDAGICIKRATDMFLSVCILILLSPVFLVLAILVKVSSPGPILYRQERIGLYGRPFMILKFRTMYDHSEQDTPILSTINDNRITPIGRVLRKYRLDELPQFINIIRGEMAIVGPRPERKYFIDKISERAPFYCMLYKIRPGLTSWGPIKVGYTDTLDKMIERLKYDIAYMENMSLELDFKILFYTIGVILDGKGQ